MLMLYIIHSHTQQYTYGVEILNVPSCALYLFMETQLLSKLVTDAESN